MLQATLQKPGRIKVITDAPVPSPGPGELLVRIKAALTCGTDLKAFRRGHPMIPMPGPLGHEMSGTVQEAGKGVRKFKKGDHIMAVHSAPCMGCDYCTKGLHNLCRNIMSTKVLGAFAEYILLPAHVVKVNTYKKPTRLSFEEAAMLEPLSCVVHGLKPLDISRHTTALVMGAGPIGLMHVLLLKQKGATVAIADPHEGRLRKARELGADKAIRVTKVQGEDSRRILRTARALTDGMGFDHVFECTGRKEAWEHSVEHLRRGGTATLFGGCPSGTKVTFDSHRIHYDELTIRGVFHFSPADVKAAYELLSKGKVDTKPLISGSYALSDISKPFALLMKGLGIKYAINP